MNGLAGFRQQYPQYNDLSDDTLAESLHEKYYKDIPLDQYRQRLGLGPSAQLDTAAASMAPTTEVEGQTIAGEPVQAPESGTPTAPFSESVKSLPERAKLASSSFIAGVPNFLQAAGANLAAVPEKTPQEMGVSPKEAREQASAAAVSAVKAQPEFQQRADVSAGTNADLAAARPANEGLPGEVLGSIVENAPSALAGVATGVLAGPAAGVAVGVGTGALQQGTSSFDETGDISYSIRTALYEGAGEAVGLHAILGHGKSLLGKMIKAVAANFGEEAAVQLAQGIDDKLTHNPEMTLGDILSDGQMWHEALVAGLSGVGTAGALAPVAHGLQRAHEAGVQNYMTELANRETELSLARQPSPDQIAYELLRPTPLPLDFGQPGVTQAGVTGPGAEAPSRRVQNAISTALEPTAVMYPPDAFTMRGVDVAYAQPSLVKFNQLGDQLISMGLRPITTDQASADLAEQIMRNARTIYETDPGKIRTQLIDTLMLDYSHSDDPTLANLANKALDSLRTAEGAAQQQMARVGFIESLIPYSQDLLARSEGKTFDTLQGSVLDPKGIVSAMTGKTIGASNVKELIGKTLTGEALPKGSIVVTGFSHQVGTQLQQTTAEWVHKLLPNAAIIITNAITHSRYNGQAWIDFAGNLVVALNSHLIDYEGKPTAKMVETLAHEVGHVVGSSLFANSPKEIQQAVLKAWNEDSLKALDKSFAEWYKGERGAVLGQQGRLLPNDVTIRQLIAQEYAEGPNGHIRDYLLNFDEWMAHNFERVLAGDTYGWQAPVRKFIMDAYKKFREIFNMYQHTFAPNATFKMFLDYHIARNAAELEGMRKWTANQVVTNLEGPASNQWNGSDVALETVVNTQPREFAGSVNSFMNWGEREHPSPQFDDDLVRWSWFKRKTYTLLQTAKLNPDMKELYDPLGVRDPQTGAVRHGYIDYVLQWARERMAWMNRADERLHQWRLLSRAEQKALATFTFEQVEKGQYLDVNDPAVRKKFELTDRVIELSQKIDQDFKAYMTAMEDILREEAMRQLASNPFALQPALTNIKRRFAELRSKPYAPMIRYGEFIVKVIATKAYMDATTNKSYRQGDTIYREHFDTKRQRDKAVSQIQGMFPGHELKLDRLPDNIRSLAGMPSAMLDALKDRLLLTEEQKQELQQYMYEIAPSQSFVKRLMQRRGVKGYSFDLQRSYANYFFHGANHIARVKYNALLREAISQMDSTANALGGDVTNRREIANYLKTHFEFIMNPKDDWASLRGVVAVAYLGGIMKTAIVNLTQVPLTTFPYLAQKYNDVKATAAIVKAYKDQYKAYHVLKPMTKAQEDAVNKWVQGQPLTAEEERFVSIWSGMPSAKREALLRAQKEGFIDESQAMELAAMSEGNWLARFKATDELGYYARAGAQALMIPFQLAEKVNRRVTFMAAYDLAEAEGLQGEALYQTAREAVSATQFEYSKWNRPELLRGKKGLFLMFMQYNMSSIHLATDGFNPNPSKWNWRWWALMFAAGGALGLPLAENLIDLAEWMLLKVHPNVKTNIRYELKKLVGDFADKIHASPDLFMHGLSRYGFGVVPFADLSGSISMGRVIPGTDIPPMLAGGSSWNDALAKAVTEAGGATSSLVLRMMQALSSNNPDTWKRIEGGLPMTMMQQQSAALRWYMRGAEQDSKGGNIVTFDPQDSWQAAEMAGKALGFTPERLSSAREDAHIKADFAQFYHVRRGILLAAVNEAHLHGDNAAMMQAIEAIKDYNREIPVKALSITGDQIRSSLQGHAKSQARENAGYGASKAEEIVRQAVDNQRF